MEKDFDSWNEIQKQIDGHSIPQEVFFKEREIWWGSIGVNVGVESNGKNELFERPLLIVRVFNKEMLWVLPITSTIKDSPFYHRFRFDGKDRSVVLSQLRVISSKRLRRHADTLSKRDFLFVLLGLVRILCVKNDST
jgi:mRNA-degrading endonuclease toxin of MazEF toxin-antitoxin module